MGDGGGGARRSAVAIMARMMLFNRNKNRGSVELIFKNIIETNYSFHKNGKRMMDKKINIKLNPKSENNVV